MKVLVYGLNHSPELTGIGKYTGELCDFLGAREGVETRVITAVPYYPRWRVYDGWRNRYSSARESGCTVYRCPLYVPASLTHVKRLVHLASFALSSLPPLARCLFWRPDRVVVIVPTLTCAPAGALLARLCGARSLLHVQDFELDAMLAIDERGARAGWKTRLARALERFVHRRFDAVSTISNSMVARLETKGVEAERAFLFPNWVDTTLLAPAPRDVGMMERHALPPDAFLVLYSGNMGEKQGLGVVLDVAERLKGVPDIVFLMVGAGATREALMADAARRELDNVTFADLVPLAELPALLCSADLHLVVQRKGVADAVMPSKLTSILAVGGQALVTSEAGSELERLASDFPGIFDHAAPEDADALTRLVEHHHRASIASGTEGRAFNRIARDFALSELDTNSVLTRFTERLERL